MSFDLSHNLDIARSIRPQMISTATGARIGASVDLRGYASAAILVEFGDLDEMGASPVGSARIDVEVEHSDDNANWTDVTANDVLGPASVTNGIVAAPTNDSTLTKVGYRMTKRYVRVILTPTGLANGGPITAVVARARPRHAPV
jgi:hypothetical protein